MILGLTGAIGAGKSTALHAFSVLGAEIYSADELCHHCYENGSSDFVRELAARWGEGIFDGAGRVNRVKIAEIVFRDPGELAFLTARIYPELERELEAVEQRFRGTPEHFAVVELPLLFECGMERRFDAVAAIWTAPELRRERLRRRGLSDGEIDRREALQWSPERKWEAADFGIVNNGAAQWIEVQCKWIKKQLFERQL